MKERNADKLFRTKVVKTEQIREKKEIQDENFMIKQSKLCKIERIRLKISNVK